MAYALKGLGFTCLVAVMVMMSGMGLAVPTARAQTLALTLARTLTLTRALTLALTLALTRTLALTLTLTLTLTLALTLTLTLTLTLALTLPPAAPRSCCLLERLLPKNPKRDPIASRSIPFAACSRDACVVSRRPRSVDTASFTSTW